MRRLYASGLTCAEVGRRIGRPANTVLYHVRDITRSASEAARLARPVDADRNRSMALHYTGRVERRTLLRITTATSRTELIVHYH